MHPKLHYNQQRIKAQPLTLSTWFERDRAHVCLSRGETTILEFWDDEVQGAFIDGFLRYKGGTLVDSICQYAFRLGLIDSPYQNVKVV